MSLALPPVSAVGRALHPLAEFHPRLNTNELRPYIGLIGVMLGAFMSTLGSRVTTFGLADLRGGIHLGFDEGAWITTFFGVGQMLVGVASPYLGAAFGIRRVMLLGIALFFTTSFLAPLSPNLSAFLAMQFLGGIGSGTFIPLTISFVLRSLPPRIVIYGVAIYAMNIELSLNVSASLEGWYSDHWGWQWILWQYCIGLPAMFACIWYGLPREGTNLGCWRQLDWPGVTYCGVGLSLLYAGLDQGNRLDWNNNGLINGLLLAGGLITLVFVARELVTRQPFLNLRLLMRGNVPFLFMLIAGFRFIILSTAYIIPNYLQTVQNYRELQVGDVLLWIALPQLLIVLPLGWLLRRVDARPVLALGSALIGIACLMATNLTSQWATVDFLPSQVLQALGQSFALTAIVVMVIRSVNLADALTVGALLQMSRLFGGEIGTAFMQTFVRVREQVHSNLVGLHIDSIAPETIDRLNAYRSAIGAHTADLGVATAQAAKLLATTVAQQASVLAYIDGFLAAAGGAFLCLLLTALIRRPLPSPFDKRLR